MRRPSSVYDWDGAFGSIFWRVKIIGSHNSKYGLCLVNHAPHVPYMYNKRTTPITWLKVNISKTSAIKTLMGRLGNRGDRVSVFGSKSCVFLAVCGQIWQIILGTFDLRSC